MKPVRLKLLLFVLIGLHWQIAAQIKINTAQMIQSPDIKADELPFLLKGIEQTINLYAANGDLFDPAKGETSESKLETFINLFSNSARVSPDFSIAVNTDESAATDYLEYAMLIFEQMKKTGSPFTISNVTLKQLSYEKDIRQYRSELVFTKTMQLGLAPGGKVVTFPKGRTIQQKMILSAETDALTEQQIIKIIAIEVAPTEPLADNTPAPSTPPAPKPKEKENPAPPSPPIAEAPKKTPKEDKPVAAPPPSPKPKEQPAAPPVADKNTQTKPTSPAQPAAPLPVITAGTPAGSPVLDLTTAQFDPKLSAQDRQNAVNQLQTALNDYVTFGALLDPVAGLVTDSYLENFRQLFRSGANIYGDYWEVEPEGLTNYDDYITPVYLNLQAKGLKYNVTSASLEKITNQFDDYYRATVVINKKMQHYLSENPRTKELTDVILTGERQRNYQLRISYSFKLGTRPDIESIESAAPVCAREREARYLTVSGRYGTSLFQPTLNTAGSSLVAGESLKATAGAILGFGIHFSSNTFYKDRKCKKPLFWSLGVDYFQTSIQTAIGSYTTTDPSVAEPFAPVFTGVREGVVSQTQQQHDLKVLEAQLGLRYRILSNFNTEIFIDWAVNPAFLWEGLYQTAPGEIKYEVTLTSNISTLRPEDFNPANSPIPFPNETRTIGMDAPAKMNTGIGLSSQLGLSIHKRLKRRLGLYASVDFKYNLLSPIQANGNGQAMPLATPESIENQGSWLQDFFSNTQQHSVGARLGFYYNLNK